MHFITILHLKAFVKVLNSCIIKNVPGVGDRPAFPETLRLSGTGEIIRRI